jgi:hypothetical protein
MSQRTKDLTCVTTNEVNNDDNNNNNNNNNTSIQQVFINALAQKHECQIQRYVKRNTKQSKHIRYRITSSSNSNDDVDDEYDKNKSSAGTTAHISTPDYITAYAGADSATSLNKKTSRVE